MEGDHPQQDYTFNGGGGSTSVAADGGFPNSRADVTGKSKMWDESGEDDAGDDELFALVGYKVKSSDMADVAEKIQHLEEAMVNDDGFSQLASDSIHRNPSNLSEWLDTMMFGRNPRIEPPVIDDSFMYTATPNVNVTATVEPTFLSVDDLLAVTGDATQPPAKKLKPSPALASTSNNPNPVVLMDSQENGIRLVQTLIACAEAVHQENLQLAENLVKQAGILAVNQVGPMRKVAAYFSEALAQKIYQLYPQTPQDSPAFKDVLQMHFYEACPYLKFAHFTANQAILEAFAGKKRVHVIDFSMKQGLQWPALMQALAIRRGGPPSFRLTGIRMPPGNDTDPLEEAGWKLARLAGTLRMEFEFRGYVADSLADIEPAMLDLREGEVIAVNSVFELHRLLAKPKAIERVLSTVKAMKPEIVTVVEQEANHNGIDFLERFNEALHYYSTIFDSLMSGSNGRGGGADGVGSSTAASNQDKIMSEVYLGKQICNVVACEGEDRVERHETLTQWKTRFDSAGFEAAHMGSNAFRQASMLLELVGAADGYKVEENNGCLMLGWYTRLLITTSAWKLK